MQTPAQTRRGDAIATVMDITCPESNGYYPTVTPGVAAAIIRPLAQLGRTDRWHNAIERWARMCEESTNDQALCWAIKQGAIFACHAAA